MTVKDALNRIQKAIDDVHIDYVKKNKLHRLFQRISVAKSIPQEVERQVIELTKEEDK